jgi:hypothetical protein
LGALGVLALALLSFYALAAGTAANADESALATQYAESTTPSSTSTTIDRVQDVSVPPSAINASGGSLGPSTILIASVLLGIVIVGSMIGGSTFITQKEEPGTA